MIYSFVCFCPNINICQYYNKFHSNCNKAGCLRKFQDNVKPFSMWLKHFQNNVYEIVNVLNNPFYNCINKIQNMINT